MQKIKTERDFYWDNIKAFLMLLVVFGHFLTPISGVKPIAAIKQIIYVFHMPLFVFVSGLFASKRGAAPQALQGGMLHPLDSCIKIMAVKFKRVSCIKRRKKLLSVNPGSNSEKPSALYQTRHRAVRKSWAFLKIYVLFQAVCIGTSAVLGKPTLNSLSMIKADGAPWYMLAMAAWMMLTPLLYRLGTFKGLMLSLTACLLFGFIPEAGDFFAFSRIFFFLPFFAAGYYADAAKTKEIFIKTKSKLTVAPALLMCIGICMCVMKEPLASKLLKDPLKMIYGNHSYAVLHLTRNPVPSHLILIGMAAVLSAAVISLIPKRETRLSYIGRRTLSVYILHRPIRDIIMYYLPCRAFAAEHPWIYVGLSFSAAVFIVLLLSSLPAAQLMSFLISPPPLKKLEISFSEGAALWKKYRCSDHRTSVLKAGNVQELKEKLKNTAGIPVSVIPVTGLETRYLIRMQVPI